MERLQRELQVVCALISQGEQITWAPLTIKAVPRQALLEGR
jgi:hypothetical protein